MRIMALPLIICTLAAMTAARADDTTLEGSPSIAQRYRESADRILQASLARNDAYMKLQELCDGIGHRLSGSPQLDQAIHWAADTLRADGQENVHIEEVMVPRWVRGAESLVMIEPRKAPIAMLGLGG
ncbi:MAG: peptidase M28 family protein, partial [Planctomycetota bacterium]|nr:peptidase M28 family protein [Planctomycetota bacterium]